jgi:hypothetical protein
MHGIFCLGLRVYLADMTSGCRRCELSCWIFFKAETDADVSDTRVFPTGFKPEAELVENGAGGPARATRLKLRVEPMVSPEPPTWRGAVQLH